MSSCDQSYYSDPDCSQEQVAVYIVVTDKQALNDDSDTSQQCELVRRLFDHPLFVTNVVKINVNHNWYKKYPELSQEDADELYRYHWCLNDAASRYPQNLVLVVKEDSTSSSSPYNIADIVLTAKRSCNWDLFYLSKWGDRCDLYTNKIEVEGQTVVISKTVSPYGTQAIVFSPSGRDIVLRKTKTKNGEKLDFSKGSLSDNLHRAISKGWIEAVTVTPNVIFLNLSSIKVDSEYQRFSQCVTPSPEPQPTPQPTPQPPPQSFNWMWLWFIILIFLIALIIAFLVRRRNQVLVLTRTD